MKGRGRTTVNQGVQRSRERYRTNRGAGVRDNAWRWAQLGNGGVHISGRPSMAKGPSDLNDRW